MAMWLTFNKMADDVPSETRTNQVVAGADPQLFPPFYENRSDFW